jgi:hypothetical protein
MLALHRTLEYFIAALLGQAAEVDNNNSDNNDTLVAGKIIVYVDTFVGEKIEDANSNVHKLKIARSKNFVPRMDVYMY